MIKVNLLERAKKTRRRLPRLRKGLIFATIVVIVCAFVGARMIGHRSTAQASNKNKPVVTSKKPVKQPGKKPSPKKKAGHARTK